MKRLTVILVILMIIFSGSISAQIIGIKGGLATSGLLYSKFTPKPDRKFGSVVGISFLKPISSHIDLGAELNYEQKGYVDHVTFTDQDGNSLGTGKYIYIFNYMVLPCYIRIHTISKMQWFLDVGIYPAYMVKSMTDVPVIDFNSGVIINRKAAFDASYLHHFDLGGLIGGGATYKVTEKFLIDINLRYNNGFLSFFDKQVLNQYMLLNSLNVSFGLNYKIK